MCFLFTRIGFRSFEDFCASPLVDTLAIMGSILGYGLGLIVSLAQAACDEEYKSYVLLVYRLGFRGFEGSCPSSSVDALEIVGLILDPLFFLLGRHAMRSASPMRFLFTHWGFRSIEGSCSSSVDVLAIVGLILEPLFGQHTMRSASLRCFMFTYLGFRNFEGSCSSSIDTRAIVRLRVQSRY